MWDFDSHAQVLYFLEEHEREREKKNRDRGTNESEAEFSVGIHVDKIPLPGFKTCKNRFSEIYNLKQFISQNL
jgi:hypothetical protein